MNNRPRQSSFLNKIMHGNLLIIGFFVVLVWLCATIIVCHNTYQRTMEEQETMLTDYANLAQETISTAVNHSEHIVKSRYILSQLSRTDFSIPEMLDFYEYSEEIIAPSSGIYGTVRIIHNNDALNESRRFSHINNLPTASTICKRLEDSKKTVIFVKPDAASSDVNMYRQIHKNPFCILEYSILLDKLAPYSSPISVVEKGDPLATDDSYFHVSINDELICVMEIPHKAITDACMQSFALCLLALILLTILIFALSKSTAKKTLQEINQFMENLTGETLLYESNFFHTTYDLYELDIIKITLQKLAMDIKSYSDAVKSAELENQRLEMELLSMQLDPHMLYNSLASIRLDAYRIQNQKIMDLVDNMVLYYRDILKKDRKFVTVQQEMESIRTYLYINELSHEKKYHLETVIDEKLLQLQIPSQILHTFVENCIVHGLSGNKKDCLIRIQMSEQDGIITTEIYDNGYGIAPEKLEDLNLGIQDSKHIGIQNSLKRLKLTYGEESSIWFESEKNVYTKVIIHFPKGE